MDIPTRVKGTKNQKPIDNRVFRKIGERCGLAYNVGRVANMEEEQQRALGNRQISLALSSMTLLERLAPKLSAILEAENLSPAD